MSSPPPRRERIPLPLLTHPFELSLGVALFLNGLAGFAGYASPSVADLPDLPLFLYLVVSTIGGAGVTIGVWITDPPGHPGLGLSLERASLYLVAASYAVLSIVLYANNGLAAIASGTVALVVGAACILRATAIRRAARIVLATLAQKRDRDE